jgi:hypothetical protein
MRSIGGCNAGCELGDLCSCFEDIKPPNVRAAVALIRNRLK